MDGDSAPGGRIGPLGRARLLARIRREFGAAEETVLVAGRPLRFVRIADPEAVLDEVCRQETLREQGVAPKRELRLPYWAAVWESGMALAEHFALRDAASPLAGRRALDLGCGMGLVGAAMAMLGARVTLADIDTAALLFARLNTADWSERCRVRRCDWQADDFPGRYDVIAGADVLYDTSQWPAIERFARARLEPGGRLVLGEPGRPKAVAYRAWLEERGWTVRTELAEACGKPVNIHEARLLV